MFIEMKGIAKDFGKTTVLSDIDLTVQSGELLALLGPSGSGKTTLLRMIAGLEWPTNGKISFQGRDVTNISAKDRKIGFVFQHYALFNHMTVAKNIAYGLRVKKKQERMNKKDIAKKVQELLALVKLEGYDDRYPSQLSGGQKQRVALARALAIEPSVLLLDEPFGALDAQVRKELRHWLRTLHKQTGVTTVFVTHDQEEALDVADQVVVMKDGQIIQTGSPVDIYESPNSPFMYKFLGGANEFKGTATAAGVNIGHATWPIDNNSITAVGDNMIGFARSHEMELSKEKVTNDQLEVCISSIHPVGPLIFIEAIHQNGEQEKIEVQLSKQIFDEMDIKVGDRMYARPQRLGVFIEDFII
ncbi:sulfate/molybdate ABC transporter ATP-binding protein [Gracilibacillus alcaliphilus]|uniref:sulfate/molybdate ABC transporter ATP-binding protein n=1 Tax=Gracilibacillus alcaliphilus TaxID=1401441 RepID=UPI00195CC67B|nr:sulfate/molybdate ABC transporter ATP-binding protein [Gracilibacillus alcaliphilus]MBM7677905.1 sulfate transport system ATP-binding protein [Gracilibacillus alcaliphilus]